MPLLSPTQIKNVLAETVKDSSKLDQLLKANSLGPEDLIEELGSTIRCSENNAMKYKGIEMGLRLNRLLGSEDNGPSAPVVNIIIHDSEFSVNPILIPR